MPITTLMSVPFAFLLGGFVFVGVLGPLGDDLDIDLATAGGLQAVYALGCAIAGPILAHFTRSWRKKPLLLATLAAMVLFNAGSAFAAEFGSLLWLRLAAGVTGALSLPLSLTFAVALAEPAFRPRAIARVYSGVAYALMLGVPVGSLLGSWLGWRSTFAFTALAALISLILVARNVPDISTQPAAAGTARIDRRAVALLGVTYLAFASMFCLVGYIGPVITALTGAGGAGAAVFQVAVGVSCLAGLTLGARLAARSGSGLPWLFAGVIGGLLVLVLPLYSPAPLGFGILALAVSAALAPLCQFATAPVVQSQLAATAGPAATFLLSLNGSMVYLGQGSGVLLGGLAINAGGLAAAPLAGTLVAAAGLIAAVALNISSTHRPNSKRREA